MRFSLRPVAKTVRKGTPWSQLVNAESSGWDRSSNLSERVDVTTYMYL